MNKYVLLAAVLALFAIGAGSSSAAVSSPDLNVTLLYYEPVPASPGSLLTVFVQIHNTGTTAEKVNIRFIDNGPFTLENEVDRVKTTDSIPSQQSFLTQYQVRVSKDALPGTNYIKLEYTVGGTNAIRAVTLPIDVFSSTVALSIDSARAEPEVFVPGSVGTLSITLRNDAGLKVSSGTVRLNLDDVDIVPVQSTNQQRFTELQQDRMQTLRFDLAPSPSLAPGIYKIPVEINFTDQQGNQYSTSEYVGLRVGALPDVSVSVDDVKILPEDKTNEVYIRVTNKGIGEIKFVNIVLGDSETYALAAGGDERYIGNIDSDDYKTARIQVAPEGDEVSMPVTVTYLDSLNNQYTKTTTLEFKAKSAGSGMGGAAIAAIILLALIIGGYWLIRRRSKKR